jgi:2'-5' RNA ligase
MPHAAPCPADRRAAPGGASPPHRLRLFVALWPDHRTRQALARLASRWRWPAGADRVAAADLHLTLHFLGAQPLSAPAALRVALDVAGPRFDLVLDHAEVWGHGTVVLVPRAAPAALHELHDRLAQRLHAIGIATERRALRPHVTLARRADGAVPPPPSSGVRWSVRGHVLASSAPRDGVRYRVLARFGPSAAT